MAGQTTLCVMELWERWNGGTVEHLNVGYECVCSKVLTTNDIAMFLVTSTIVTTIIFQPEPNYHVNRFQQSILLVEKILLVWVKPTIVFVIMC